MVTSSEGLATPAIIQFSALPRMRKEKGYAVFGHLFDSDAGIFLHGVKIGGQKPGVNVMWKRRFRMPLPANPQASDDGKDHLVVRVGKDRFSGACGSGLKS